jgi:hypothetical protein
VQAILRIGVAQVKHAFAVFLALLAFGALPSAARSDDINDLVEALQRMKPLALAMHEYQAQHDHHFPPPAITDKHGHPLLSWRVAILPYLGEEELFRQFHLEEPWDSPHNKPLLEKMPAAYAPFGAEARDKFLTFYQVFVGKGAAIEGVEGTAFEEIHDGLDNTLLIIEADRPVPWTKPDDLPFDPAKPLPKVGGQFVNYFHATFCDGSGRRLPKDIGEDVLRAIITRNGGEDVDF